MDYAVTFMLRSGASVYTEYKYENPGNYSAEQFARKIWDELPVIDTFWVAKPGVDGGALISKSDVISLTCNKKQ